MTRIMGASLSGVDGIAIEVEVRISSQLPRIDIVGLPEASMRESASRVRAAIGSVGRKFPDQRVTVNLAPAAVRKGGAGRYAGVVALFALGLMAKPMVVTLPLVLLLLDYWPLRRQQSWAKLVVEKLPLFALSAASSMSRLSVRTGPWGPIDRTAALCWSAIASRSSTSPAYTAPSAAALPSRAMPVPMATQPQMT